MSRTVLFLLTLALSCQATPAQPGRNTVWVRAHAVDVYRIPALAPPRQPARKVLFIPGDGGWRGFAISMANTVASWGYDVYGLDTRRYLEAFTSDQGALKEADVMEDLRMIGLWAGGGSEKVLLVGWSEGAGLCVLGAAGSGKQDVFAGVVAIGLGEQTVLGWRLADALTWITRRVPNEPTFRSVSYLAKVAPLRLAVLHSSGDEYTRPERVKEMFAAAAEPKRLDLIEARNHRFDGGRDRFFSALRTSLDWTAGVRP